MKHRSYAKYSVACWVVWVILLVVNAANGRIKKVAPVFGGWVIGWTSATIARAVYPPPMSRGTTGVSAGAS